MAGHPAFLADVEAIKSELQSDKVTRRKVRSWHHARCCFAHHHAARAHQHGTERRRHLGEPGLGTQGQREACGA